MKKIIDKLEDFLQSYGERIILRHDGREYFFYAAICTLPALSRQRAGADFTPAGRTVECLSMFCTYGGGAENIGVQDTVECAGELYTVEDCEKITLNACPVYIKAILSKGAAS